MADGRVGRSPPSSAQNLIASMEARARCPVDWWDVVPPYEIMSSTTVNMASRPELPGSYPEPIMPRGGLPVQGLGQIGHQILGILDPPRRRV